MSDNSSKSMFLSTLRAVATRMGISARLGRSYDGDRDVYTALGYPTEISLEDYFSRYYRQDIAKRVVTAFPDATWRGKLKVVEDRSTGTMSPTTEFEKAWDSLEKDLKVLHYLKRADKVSGIGQFGALFMGFSGNGELKKPIKSTKKGSKLIYLSPYSEDNVEVDTWVSSPTDPRFGLPNTYRVKQASNVGVSVSSKTLIVHHSRLIHIAEGLNEDDVFGTPRLEVVWNRLMNLELLAGGSAEMFWRGAFPGISFEAEDDADFDEQSKTDLNDEIDKYMHKLQRSLKLQGVKANQLSVQIADPSKHFDIQVKLISAATGIPVRILIGAESGELASSQDETAWNSKVEERRIDYAEPLILRPFIDKMIETGVLPEPKQYEVIWPDIFSPSEADQASINKRNSESLATYANAPNASKVVLPKQFLQRFLGFTEAETQDTPDILPDAKPDTSSSSEADLERDGNEKKRDGKEE